MTEGKKIKKAKVNNGGHHLAATRHCWGPGMNLGVR